ncbi:type II CAAX prenyl endopeptidase Rce1 family protein [Chloroflexota bacterium]
MTTLESNTEKPMKGLAKVWQRTPVLIRALVLGFLVNTIGILNIPILTTFLPPVLALIAISIFLFLYWKFFSGSWGHAASKATRKHYFRANTLSTVQWRWGLFTAVLLAVIWQAGFVVTFRLIEYPAAQFTQGNGLDNLPTGIAWIAVIFAALSAGICEEVGFRGYMQVPLEERYGPIVAILINSIIFVGIHLHQPWAPPVLPHLFVIAILFGILAYVSKSLVPGIIAHFLLDIGNFSYWWSDIAGKFEYQTIAITGVDLHFIVWLLIFVASSVLSIWGLFKINSVRLQS